MALALVLSIMSSRAQQPQSILRQDVAPTVEAGQSILQTLDQSGDAGGSAEPNEPPPGGDGNN